MKVCINISLVASLLMFTMMLGCQAAPETGTPSVADPGAKPASVSVGVFADAPMLMPSFPTRLALAGDGTVYVSDPHRNAVFGIKEGVTEVRLTELDQPLGVAISGDRLYVGSQGSGSVDVYNVSEWTFLYSLGDGPGEFEMPNALAIGPNGRVFVADSTADVVRIYDEDGGFQGQIGGRGDSEGKLRFPSAIAVDSDRIFVGDQGNHRIQVFDHGGQFLFSFGGPISESVHSARDFEGGFTRIQGLTIGESKLYVLDSYHAHVQVFDLKGKSLEFLGRRGTCEDCVALALDVALDGVGDLLITDPERHRVISLSTSGEVTP